MLPTSRLKESLRKLFCTLSLGIAMTFIIDSSVANAANSCGLPVQGGDGIYGFTRIWNNSTNSVSVDGLVPQGNCRFLFAPSDPMECRNAARTYGYDCYQLTRAYIRKPSARQSGFGAACFICIR